MPAPNLGGLLPLLGRQHRIELPSGTPDDGIQLRLHLPAHGTKLPALTIHDRVDPALLLLGEPHFAGKPVAELPIPRGRAPHSVVLTRVVIQPGEKHQPIQSDAGDTARKQRQQEYQRGRDRAPGTFR